MSAKKELEKAARKAAKRAARRAEQAAEWNPMRALGGLGVRSRHAYTAGLAVAALALLTWPAARRRRAEGEGSGTRRVLLGQWAPVLLLIGLGLRHEEES